MLFQVKWVRAPRREKSKYLARSPTQTPSSRDPPPEARISRPNDQVVVWSRLASELMEREHMHRYIDSSWRNASIAHLLKEVWFIDERIRLHCSYLPVL